MDGFWVIAIGPGPGLRLTVRSCCSSGCHEVDSVAGQPLEASVMACVVHQELGFLSLTPGAKDCVNNVLIFSFDLEATRRTVPGGMVGVRRTGLDGVGSVCRRHATNGCALRPGRPGGTRMRFRCRWTAWRSSPRWCCSRRSPFRPSAGLAALGRARPGHGRQPSGQRRHGRARHHQPDHRRLARPSPAHRRQAPDRHTQPARHPRSQPPQAAPSRTGRRPSNASAGPRTTMRRRSGTWYR
jgi:hypothetical protein